jgi:transposase InsO family protein
MGIAHATIYNGWPNTGVVCVRCTEPKNLGRGAFPPQEDVNKFRTFNVMDDCTGEALAIEIDTSLSSKRIVRTLESVIAWRGKIQVIRTDNGPEFTFKEFEWWCKEHEIEIQFIQPDRPMQNGYIERFNPVYR